MNKSLCISVFAMGFCSAFALVAYNEKDFGVFAINVFFVVFNLSVVLADKDKISS